MKQLLPYPLPVGTVEAQTLNVGDTFLRVDGAGATTPSIWLLAAKGDGVVAFFNPVDGSYIPGIGGNHPVVPCPGCFTATV